MKTVRNLALAAAVAALGIGAAFAQDSAKPATQPEAAHAQHGQHGGCHAGGERHQHQKDGRHEHDRR